MTWAPLLKLGRMVRLRSLSVSFPGCMHAGAGLQYLARSVAGLSDLQSLAIEFNGSFQSESSLAASLSFIGRLVGLSSLTLGDAPSMAPPAWLSSLTALSHIHANLQLSPVNVAVLAALPALRRLEGVTWTAGGGGALPAACCPGVLVLDNVRVHHSGLPSLAAAFPGLRGATITEVVDGDDDEDGEAPHPAATAPAPAAWHSLQTLAISGFNTLQERHMAAALDSLLSLLRGAGELTTLELKTDDDGEDFTAWGDADVAALLARAPLSLERLTLYPAAALTDAAVAGCPYRPALKALHLLWTEPPELTPAGLLALGRALPGLVSLYFIADQDGPRACDEETESAWVQQLDALGGGGGGGGGTAEASSRAADGDDESSDGEDDGSDGEEDDELVLAIRRALAREAAAGAPLA